MLFLRNAVAKPGFFKAYSALVRPRSNTAVLVGKGSHNQCCFNDINILLYHFNFTINYRVRIVLLDLLCLDLLRLVVDLLRLDLLRLDLLRLDLLRLDLLRLALLRLDLVRASFADLVLDRIRRRVGVFGLNRRRMVSILRFTLLWVSGLVTSTMQLLS